MPVQRKQLGISAIGASVPIYVAVWGLMVDRLLKQLDNLLLLKGGKGLIYDEPRIDAVP